MGESVAADWHWRDASKGIIALLDYLEDLEGY